jgi:GH25 family lysozyme M1 (1,4-beta-N-acetylmuramidase)
VRRLPDQKQTHRAHTPSHRRTGGKRSVAKKKSKLPGLFAGLLLFALTLMLLFAVVIPKLREFVEEETEPQQEVVSSAVHMIILPYCPYDNDNFIDNADGTLSYEDETYTSLAGIDISSHQDEIDWEAAAADGLSFAIVRLGWRGYSVGELCEDQLALSNLKAAKENGLLVGAYFYSQATTPEEAQAEAELALKVLDGFELDLPVYYDWELDTRSGSRSATMDHTTLTECAKAFCTTIEDGGYEAGIYFYRSLGEDTYDLDELARYDFWLSQPADRPSFSHGFTIWQYTYEGQIDGISTDVDLDIMFIERDPEPTDES